MVCGPEEQDAFKMRKDAPYILGDGLRVLCDPIFKSGHSSDAVFISVSV